MKLIISSEIKEHLKKHAHINLSVPQQILSKFLRKLLKHLYHIEILLKNIIVDVLWSSVILAPLPWIESSKNLLLITLGCSSLIVILHLCSSIVRFLFLFILGFFFIYFLFLHFFFLQLFLNLTQLLFTSSKE